VYLVVVHSMTGFGRGTAEQGRVRATVDIRSVNHRFLDLKLRGASLQPALEEGVSAKVRGALERGAVTVSVHLVRAGEAATRIDIDAAKATHRILADLAHKLSLQPPDLSLVLAQPGVVIAGDDHRDETDDVAVLAATDQALAQLATMRNTEGQALARELSSRIDELARLRETILGLAGDVPERVKKKLQERLGRLLADDVSDRKDDMLGWLDPALLARELAVLAERADISEELVRLESHLAQTRALIAGKAASGRRLDFLVQEIGRELNTIGSKSALAEITTAVVEAKAVLEKVREQVQNVE
jgi:uncharacterized protein (TIGR00255 family)